MWLTVIEALVKLMQAFPNLAMPKDLKKIPLWRLDLEPLDDQP
jgi:hypothetical protein